MGALLKSLFGPIVALFTSDTAQKLVEIGLEKTEDVDKRNALIMQYLAMREETRRIEVNRVTIPWVDALHKMGRQIIAVVSIVTVGAIVAVCLVSGHAAELERATNLILAALGIGGGYTVIKGRGQ